MSKLIKTEDIYDDFTSVEDAIAIGRKIAAMADMVRAANEARPGAQASWHFEVDDVRFKVVVTVECGS